MFSFSVSWEPLLLAKEVVPNHSASLGSFAPLLLLPKEPLPIGKEPSLGATTTVNKANSQLHGFGEACCNDHCGRGDYRGGPDVRPVAQ